MKIVLEVVVIRLNVIWDVPENVVNFMAFKVLDVVGKDDKMWVALEL